MLSTVLYVEVNEELQYFQIYDVVLLICKGFSKWLIL